MLKQLLTYTFLLGFSLQMLASSIPLPAEGSVLPPHLVELSNANSDHFLSQPYPNPAKEYTHVEVRLASQLAGAKIKVVNLIGATVYETPLHHQQDRLRITTESLDSGVYFIYLLSDQQIIHTQKLIVAK